jgi:hypothetical protein
MNKLQRGRCDLTIYENADHAFNDSPEGGKVTTRDMDDLLVSHGYLINRKMAKP